MFIRLFLAALVPLCGMRGLQACIGAGHFHLELAHSHKEHCEGHAHKESPSNSSECSHYDDHVHIGLSIEDPAKKTAGGIKVKQVGPRLIGFTVHSFSPQTPHFKDSSKHPFETLPGTYMPRCNPSNAHIVMLL